MKTVKVGDRMVGEGQPTYIIAEAGSNHNGNFDQALRLIDAAAEARVDAVKFQHFKAARLYPKSAGQSRYLKMSRPIYDIIHEMETPDAWVPKLAAYCQERGVVYLSTPFDEAAADLLEPYMPAFKIASYELTHLPLVRHIARKGKPMILSTGTASLDEVLDTVDAVRAEGNHALVILQCTASYPASLTAINLRALVTLREATDCPTGLSDHSRDPVVAPIAAVALGACVIEKHFTLSNRLPGPDHPFAIEGHELRALVQRVRETEQALGTGRKEVLSEERELHAFARRTIFATRPIKSGEPLTPENIAVLRCGEQGFGLPPKAWDVVLGRRAAQGIAAEVPITLKDLI